ncbi:hypothetical protein O181_087014 [Austropuccinia psidii MF-1]|uniref:Uncharacterized protein n=1 Tax=Austropuccinia psidii MF-1 TaxID=1389203 RepID=A0A9Q3INX4_9BASI|nr:hypothetical protein [Austropuccinia psidii MF-1]
MPPPPNPSTARPALISPVRSSPIPQPRKSPMLTSKQLQHVASSRKRKEDKSTLPFPSVQVFQKREFWLIQVTREDANVENDGQDSLSRLFRKVQKNSRVVIVYLNDRMIPGTASKGMAAKFAWYEDELINYFKRTFDDLGRDK